MKYLLLSLLCAFPVCGKDKDIEDILCKIKRKLTVCCEQTQDGLDEIKDILIKCCTDIHDQLTVCGEVTSISEIPPEGLIISK